MSKYDMLDYKIIKCLQSNARMPSLKMAKELNTSERTIRRRIDKLIKQNAIKLTLLCQPNAFGFTSIADIFISVPEENFNDVIEFCKNSEDVVYISINWETSKIVIQARCKGVDELLMFINETLPKIPNLKVERYDFVKIIKDMDEWVPSIKEFSDGK